MREQALLPDADLDLFEAWRAVLDRRVDRGLEMIAGRDDVYVRFVRALAAMFDGRFAEAIDLLIDSASEMFDLKRRDLAEHALYRAADALYYVGRLRDSLRRYELLYEDTEDPHIRVGCLWNLGYVYAALGELDRARRRLLQAEAQPDVPLRTQISIYNGLGDVARISGDPKEAERRFHQVLLRLKAMSDVGFAVIQANLAMALLDQGRALEAHTHSEDAVASLEMADARGAGTWPLAVFMCTAPSRLVEPEAAEVLDRLERGIGDLVDIECAKALSRASARTRDAGWHVTAARLGTLAARQMKALGDDERAATLLASAGLASEGGASEE